MGEYIRLPNSFERPDLVLFHRALILFALDKCKEAIGNLTDLLSLMPDSAHAVNCLSLFHLYSGDVTQGSNFLESFLITHPLIGGKNPQMIFNLTSMYDLTDSSLAKKRALMKVIIQGCGDDFDPSIMKLNG